MSANKLSIRLFFCCIFLLFHSVTSAKENRLPELYLKLIPSVVTLHTFNNKVSKNKVVVSSTPNGLGSGVVISKAGLIVTAAHVVHSADALHVEFSNGERRKGKVISSLKWADLALIKVEDLPEKTAVAKLGDSDKVMIGERVFVIGAPLGLSQTLTVGYISGRHQAGKNEFAPLAEFFQTDAAINPGNSGGPLFNMQGEVVGIASYIQSKSGGSDGLGFTVTSNSVEQLILSRGYFWSGLEVFPLDADLARAFQLPQKSGAIVQKVASDSPAQSAGIIGGNIRAVLSNLPVMIGGDIILSVNGIKIDSKKNLSKIMHSITKIKTDENITLEIWRGGKKQAFILKAD